MFYVGEKIKFKKTGELFTVENRTASYMTIKKDNGFDDSKRVLPSQEHLFMKTEQTPKIEVTVNSLLAEWKI